MIKPSATNGGVHSLAGRALLSGAAYFPRLRLQRREIAAALAWMQPPRRGIPSGARAVANWDEDALTMAVEAARGCLRAHNAPRVEAALFCSTTSPFADRDPAGILCAALDLPCSCATMNFGGSLRAGVAGLVEAARRGGTNLVMASELRLTRPGSAQELLYGEGAAALCVGDADGSELAELLANASIGADFVDHYRASGNEFDYALEERWVRDESLLKLAPEVISKLLDAAGSSAADIAHLALPFSGSTAARIAQAAGLAAAHREERVFEHGGDCGAALPLCQLLGCLARAKPGELLLLLGIGQGVDAVLLRAGSGSGVDLIERALARQQAESSYVRYLSHRNLIEVDFGMRAERDERTAHTVAYRKRAAVTSFVGGRCERCGTVQFPRSRVCVNPDCRATDSQLAHRLADSVGRVKSFTEDWQAFSVRPPFIYGNVEFREGGNLLMEIADAASGEIKVGDEVRFVFRIKDLDRARHFRRYFWKATSV
ncbi:MAG TPA: OB-fold domain-containing protein [Steroidobacteraceae bacterium]